MNVHPPAPNQAYFIVVFEDEDLTIPLVQTLLFKEVGMRADGTEYYMFHELHSDGEPTALVLDAEHAKHLVLDRDELLEKLARSATGRLATTPR